MPETIEARPNLGELHQDISPRLKRKLDKHLATKHNKLGGKRIGAGRKPLHEKHLSRNYAAKLFHEISIREHIHQLLTEKDARLRFEVIRYLWDRLEGKPFVAVNPAENKQVNTLLQDNRIQVAIQQLVPPKTRRTKRSLPSPPSVETKQLTSEVIPIIDSEVVSGD